MEIFRMCLERTLGAPAEAPGWSPLQIAQYKFEVEDKLRRLYLRGGQTYILTQWGAIGWCGKIFDRRRGQARRIGRDDAPTLTNAEAERQNSIRMDY
ncbi:MAG: hypothetical protein Q8O52_21055 [Sulfuritalea sp.]|nr:hypothetical protein [Sulfuritalea sp.]